MAAPGASESATAASAAGGAPTVGPPAVAAPSVAIAVPAAPEAPQTSLWPSSLAAAAWKHPSTVRLGAGRAGVAWRSEARLGGDSSCHSPRTSPRTSVTSPWEVPGALWQALWGQAETGRVRFVGSIGGELCSRGEPALGELKPPAVVGAKLGAELGRRCPCQRCVATSSKSTCEAAPRPLLPTIMNSSPGPSSLSSSEPMPAS